MATDGPADADRRISVIRHRSEKSAWDFLTSTPAPALADYVSTYVGYREFAPLCIRRRETPSSGVVMVINFGAPFQLNDTALPDCIDSRLSFIAGPHRQSSVVTALGTVNCLQINFTSLGAYRFVGRPLSEFTDSVVELRDVMGIAADYLVEQLQDFDSWRERFALLDRTLAARLRDAPRPPWQVVEAWRRLNHRAGDIEIGRLAADLDCSRKHLSTRFAACIGLPPKTYAQILRFNRALEALDGQATPDWAEIANICGYFDQAHFNRAFRRFTGLTPTDYTSRMLPDAGGIAD